MRIGGRREKQTGADDRKNPCHTGLSACVGVWITVVSGILPRSALDAGGRNRHIASRRWDTRSPGDSLPPALPDGKTGSHSDPREPLQVFLRKNRSGLMGNHGTIGRSLSSLLRRHGSRSLTLLMRGRETRTAVSLRRGIVWIGFAPGLGGFPRERHGRLRVLEAHRVLSFRGWCLM